MGPGGRLASSVELGCYLEQKKREDSAGSGTEDTGEPGEECSRKAEDVTRCGCYAMPSIQ